MTRLKLSDIADEKPVKLTIEIPARLHSDLVAYGVVINGGNASGENGGAKLDHGSGGEVLLRAA